MVASVVCHWPSMSRKKESLTLVDGKHAAESTFHALLNTPEDYFLIEVYDDRYKPLGTALTRLEKLYEPDDRGAFIKLHYVGCSDGHYKWYIEQEGKAGGLPQNALHHFCRDDPDKCPVKAPRGTPVLHVRRWSPVDRRVANEALRTWGYPGLPVEAGSPAPAKVPKADKRPAEKDTGGRHKGRERDAPAATSKRKAARIDRSGHDDVDYDDQTEGEESEEEPPPRKGALKSEQAALKNFLAKDTALDAMLDREVDAKPNKELEDKLADLRKKLRGKGEVPANVGKKPGGILARRAAENVEKGARKKRRKRRSSGSRVTAEVKKALNRKRKREDSYSTGSYEGSSGEEGDGGGEKGGWESKRKRFKKIAEESPGKLLMTSLEDMEELLGARFGESSGEKMNPVVTRYLLSVVTPSLGGKASKSTMRELRTIALAVDYLLKGKGESAGDVLIQRFKSLAMQLRHGSERFGPQIELLPEDITEAGGSLGEDTFAREMAYRDGKSREMMNRALGPKTGSHI